MYTLQEEKQPGQEGIYLMLASPLILIYIFFNNVIIRDIQEKKKIDSVAQATIVLV